MKNGRVIKLEGNPVDPMSQGRMCAKGLAGIQALYHPNRNKYPLLRVGERGSGRWRRISWDEALTRVAEKAMETREKYGAEALFCTTGAVSYTHLDVYKRQGFGCAWRSKKRGHCVRTNVFCKTANMNPIDTSKKN